MKEEDPGAHLDIKAALRHSKCSSFSRAELPQNVKAKILF